MNWLLSKTIRAWLPLAIVITLICGILYVVMQQNYRISANDPQIQIGEDVADQLSRGQDPLTFVPSYKIELSKSLATYIMVFDKDSKLIASSVVVDGKNPVLPKGVFSDTKNSKEKEKRFTWQPKTGVRSAIVLDYYSGKQSGFVAVGRSLKEVEKRIDNLTAMVFIGWLVTLAASFMSVQIFKAK